ncbi:sce7726 family protein [Rhodanobacter sp. UC4451_H18]
MTYADDLKIVAISTLLPTLGQDEVIGLELRFGDGRYRADLVISSPSRLSSFEIKGERDNLDKLPDQVAGYTKMFLDFSVMTAPVWLPSLRERLPRSIGIWTVDSQLKRVRQPYVKSLLPKASAAAWLRTSELRSLLSEFGLSAAGTLSAMTTTAEQNIPATVLSERALRTVYERLLPRYSTFLRELGRTVTLDDVRVLTLGDDVIGSGD